MYFEKKSLSKRSFSFICVSPAFYLYSGGNSGTVTDAQHVRHKPRWPIRVNFLVLEMLSLQVSMVIEQGDAWQVTGGLHDHGLLACIKWITPANDPQTPKDPSNEPQKILEPNDPHWWAQMIPRGKLECPGLKLLESIKFNQNKKY